MKFIHWIEGWLKPEKQAWHIFTLIFFLSGAASLVYEVIWMRRLTLLFGSDIYSSSITLAAFMGGMAIGSYLASLLADRLRLQLIWYGLLEITIGIYALGFTKILGGFDNFFVTVYLEYSSSAPLVYQLIKGIVTFITLLIPTMMMGATLPMILKIFTHQSKKFGRVASHFYAINTFGGVVGVLISGMILIPNLGLNATNFIGALGNIVIGLTSIFLFQIKSYRDFFAVGTQPKTKQALSLTPKTPPPYRRAALMAIGISGFGALALEVIWTHLLIRSFSATVYSFSMMLVSFLLGIAIGSKLIDKRINSSFESAAILAKLEIIMALYVTGLASLSYLIPTGFAAMVWGITKISLNLFGLASVFGTLFISTLFILPMTVLFGAAFPAALKAYNMDVQTTGKNSGRVFFINTIGSVLGALAAGFLLIPLVGSKNGLLILGILFLVNGLYLQKSIRSHEIKKFYSVGFIFIILFGLGLLLPPQTVLNYNLQKNTHPQIIYHSEDVAGVVDVIKNNGGDFILSLDGNIESDTSLAQRQHFVLKAHLPLLLQKQKAPKEVLIVGLGLGITTQSVLAYSDVQRIDVVELLPAVVEAQKYLKEINGDILSQFRVKVYIDDGRNFLKATQNNYDVITADPVHPRISGAGVLYTKEYYQLVREKLKPTGIILQWIPLYSISPESFGVAVRTMVEVFPNISVWYVPNHILLLGAKGDEMVFDFKLLNAKLNEKNIKTELQSIGINNAQDLLKLQIMTPDQTKCFLKHQPINILNTEDFSYLEYRTPLEYLERPTANLRNALLSCPNSRAEMITGAPQKFLNELNHMREIYQAGI